jgi:RNA polymerase sigma factor (sigma-70 family)
LLEDSDIKEQDISQRLQLRKEALRRTRGTIYEDDQVAQNYLVALLHFKKTGSIDFAEDKMLPALAELMDFHERVKKIEAKKASIPGIPEKQLAKLYQGTKFENFTTTKRLDRIATGLELFLKNQQNLEGMQNPISLDQEWPTHIQDGDLPPEYTVSILESLTNDQPGERPTEEFLEKEEHTKELREALYKVLGELRPKEREALIMRYGLRDGKEYTLRDIGATLGVSYQRVGNILDRALLKLKYPSRAEILQDFRQREKPKREKPKKTSST